MDTAIEHDKTVIFTTFVFQETPFWRSLLIANLLSLDWQSYASSWNHVTSWCIVLCPGFKKGWHFFWKDFLRKLRHFWVQYTPPYGRGLDYKIMGRFFSGLAQAWEWSFSSRASSVCIDYTQYTVYPSIYKQHTGKEELEVVSLVFVVFFSFPFLGLFLCQGSFFYVNQIGFIPEMPRNAGSEAGAWACFDEFNRIQVEVLSVPRQKIVSFVDFFSANSTSFTLLLDANSLRIPFDLFAFLCLYGEGSIRFWSESCI